MSFLADLLYLSVFPLAVSYAGVNDLINMRIPNKISLVLIGGFFVTALVVGMPWMDFFLHLGISMCTLVVMFLLFSFGGVGGGDAKLIPAVSLWFASDALLSFFLLTAIYGGVLTILVLYLRSFSSMLPNFLSRLPWLDPDRPGPVKIPYGVAIAVAAIQVYQSSSIAIELS